MKGNDFIFIAVENQNNWVFKSFASNDSEIPTYIESQFGNHVYITPNSFKDATRRTRANVSKAKTIFLDIDHIDHENGILSLNNALVFVESLKPHFNVLMPTPTLINHSGRGIHLYFSIEPVDQLDQYQIVAKALALRINEMLDQIDSFGIIDFKIDMSAIGAERLIRAEGSYNRNSQTVVTRIFESNSKYSLDDICANFLPDNLYGEKSIYKTARNNNDSKQNSGKAYKPYLSNFSSQTWFEAALMDLQSLRDSRNQYESSKSNKQLSSKGNVGSRNNTLFIYSLVCHLLYKDPQVIKNHLFLFNQGFNKSLSKSEVHSTFKSVIKYNGKPPRTCNIIQSLSISLAEQKNMQVLIGPEEIKRRKKIYMKNYKAKIAQQRAEAKQLLILKTKELFNNGMTAAEVAVALSISRRTVFYYLKKTVQKQGAINHCIHGYSDKQ